MSDFIKFEERASASGKTKVFNVMNVAGNFCLGTIQWYASWRRYAFHPGPGTTFDHVCLEALRDKCKSETEAHYAKKRAGFTLVELLVVIATIAILALIALQAAGAAIDLARHKSTESTLFRLQHFTKHRQEGFDRWLKRSPGILDGSWEMLAVKRDPRTKDLPYRVQRMVAIKLYEGKLFPQAPSEMWDAKAYPTPTSLQRALVDEPLMQSDRIPGDDVLLLKDAWGSDIAFYRWPTELFRAHPELLPDPLYIRDVEDPLSDLIGLWNKGDEFSQVIKIQMPEPCRVSLMVFVSPGPDRELGMSGPLGHVDDESLFQDNLISLRVR